MRRRLLAGILAIAAVIAVPMVAGGRSGSSLTFSAASVKGTWVWAFEGRLVRNQYAQLGLATFDGKKTCTLKLKENSGANGGYDHTSTQCTYSVGRNGMGSMTFSLDGEAGSALMAVGPSEVRLTSPDPGNAGSGVMRRASLAGIGDLVGRWTFSLEGSIFGEKLGGAGVMKFDGKGGCSQSLAYNYGTGVQEVSTETCTYSFDPNKIGLATITYDNDTGGDSYFLTANGTKQLFLLTTAEGETLFGHGIKG